MKQIILLLAAGTFLFFASCNEKTEKTTGDSMGTEKKENPVVEKNIAISHAVSKAFETGDVSALDSIVADDFLDHTDRGDKVGRDSLKAMISFVHNNFKDMKMETLNEVADNDYVYSRMRFTGTTDGTMGMPKGPYDMQVIELARFKDGKAVEHWEFMDIQTVMKMMAPPASDKMKGK
jgi:predicted SnoaL-like aldol condensation-catalyzing enzyme